MLSDAQYVELAAKPVKDIVTHQYEPTETDLETIEARLAE
jgi:hypothetical protein